MEKKQNKLETKDGDLFALAATINDDVSIQQAVWGDGLFGVFFFFFFLVQHLDVLLLPNVCVCVCVCVCERERERESFYMHLGDMTIWLHRS